MLRLGRSSAMSGMKTSAILAYVDYELVTGLNAGCAAKGMA
jgi:hypothetical protein